jgi:hypothetical protein
LHLVIANIKAGGVGISLHLGKRRKRGLHFPTWSAIDLKQALGRLYRANAENDVKQRIVYCSTGENKNLENPDAQEAAMASMVTNDKELNLDEVLSQIYQGKSKEEIDEEIKKIEVQVTGRGGTLEMALTQQGMTEEKLREQITIQKKLEKLLADKVAVTEAEIDTYIKDSKATPPKDMKMEDFRKQNSDRLKQQKFQQEAQKWVSDLTASAKIKYYVNY